MKKNEWRSLRDAKEKNKAELLRDERVVPEERVFIPFDINSVEFEDELVAQYVETPLTQWMENQEYLRWYRERVRGEIPAVRYDPLWLLKYMTWQPWMQVEGVSKIDYETTFTYRRAKNGDSIALGASDDKLICALIYDGSASDLKKLAEGFGTMKRGFTISRQDVAHWVACASDPACCPIFPGETRIYARPSSADCSLREAPPSEAKEYRRGPKPQGRFDLFNAQGSWDADHDILEEIEELRRDREEELLEREELDFDDHDYLDEGFYNSHLASPFDRPANYARHVDERVLSKAPRFYEGAHTPDVHKDPRGRNCLRCGRRLYPEEVCECDDPPQEDPEILPCSHGQTARPCNMCKRDDLMGALRVQRDENGAKGFSNRLGCVFGWCLKKLPRTYIAPEIHEVNGVSGRFVLRGLDEQQGVGNCAARLRFCVVCPNCAEWVPLNVFMRSHKCPVIYEIEDLRDTDQAVWRSLKQKKSLVKTEGK